MSLRVEPRYGAQDIGAVMAPHLRAMDAAPLMEKGKAAGVMFAALLDIIQKQQNEIQYLQNRVGAQESA